MSKRAKRGANARGGRAVRTASAAEQRVLEAALKAYRTSKAVLAAAHDPVSSARAFEAVFAATDEVAQTIVKAAEEALADDEEPAEFRDADRRFVRVLHSERTLHSTRGPIRVRRALYRDAAARNSPTRCPYDERRGVMPGGYLPGLGKAVVKAVARMPAAAAADLLADATGHRLALTTMKDLTAAVGAALRGEADARFACVFAHDAVPAAARTLVICADGIHVPIRVEGYKQAMVATLTFLDADGVRLDTIYLGEMPEAGKAAIMARVKAEVAAILRQRPDLQTEVVIDGAKDLREHLVALFPDALHVTDFFHVIEHVAAALQLLFPTDDARRHAERTRWCHALKHEVGTADRLHAWLWAAAARADEPLTRWAREQVEGHAEYVFGQRDFLIYPQAANDGMALGSGVVEAGCKTLATQRLKVSGAKWSRDGGAAILHLRELLLSDRFERAFAFHQAGYAA